MPYFSDSEYWTVLKLNFQLLFRAALEGDVNAIYEIIWSTASHEITNDILKDIVIVSKSNISKPVTKESLKKVTEYIEKEIKDKKHDSDFDIILKDSFFKAIASVAEEEFKNITPDTSTKTEPVVRSSDLVIEKPKSGSTASVLRKPVPVIGD